jgi:von Willebrand factor type A domain
MNSLPVKILTAVLTFAIGVGIATLWLNTWGAERIVCRFPVGTRPAARLEMVFVLDTTGSMGGLLDGAKQRIWGIVNNVMREQHASVRVGLVGYRDRGDLYVTRVLPLTEDLDKVYTTLMDYEAAGGGDGPEDVRSALSDGVLASGWSAAAPDLSQIIFLVGDAPPHNDYNDAADTLITASNAVQKGIIVNTIQCGFSRETERAWKMIADSGHGQYFAIAADGGVQAIVSPYDEQLADLASKLGATFTPYGFGAGSAGDEKRAEAVMMTDAAEARVAASAPVVAKAERAVNKAISANAYIGDLLQQIENGSVSLEAIDTAQLPADLRGLASYDRRLDIERRLATRRDLRHQILLLSKQRDAFIEAERKKSSDDGFDVIVTKALHEQMARPVK